MAHAIHINYNRPKYNPLTLQIFNNSLNQALPGSLNLSLNISLDGNSGTLAEISFDYKDFAWTKNIIKSPVTGNILMVL